MADRDHGTGPTDETRAAYVFGVTLQFDPPAATVSPDRIETIVRIPAPDPGREGWLLFRDRLWHGEVSDPERFRRPLRERLGLEDAPGIEIVDASFRELRTDASYLRDLRDAVESDPTPFADDDPDAVLHAYLGSSIHVRE
ncbi:hypothetical protein SAMN05192561_102256 [Halopenitus malekzadehii]|uniref:LWR-salt protein n=1 Tax=Halopenitus malekzadehii TaxID=1267564 RepID=A0A1H6ILS9_9EURY|nr:LWR-salt protein [Halopenitus malekzadehii]SEH47240.1 hypothetical protein SAMN05192561_102256 [Halopenitus malekzadehii]